MRLTGSRLPLARLCSWWARPEVQAPEAQAGDPDAAALGTTVHGGINQFLSSSEGPIVGLPMPAVVLFEVWRADPIAHERWAPEVRVAWDPATDTGRELDAGAHRDYSGVCPGEIAGTCDAMRVEESRVVVVDWKVTTGPDLHADPAERNLQLAFYALALARAHGTMAARVGVARIEADGVSVEWADLDALALDGTAEILRGIVAGIPTSRPRPGPHCTERWCPALAVCPAAQAASEAIVLATATGPLTVTLEIAPALLARVKLVRAAADAVEAALRELADAAGGIPLADGRVWRRREETHESIALDGPDMAEALSVLAAAGADGAVETKASASWKAVEATLRTAHPGRGEAKRALETLKEELRAKGLLRSKTVPKYEATKGG